MDTIYPLDQDKTALSILEKLHGLLGIDRNDAEPNSVEARRRLTFFANSLFMDMPRAPPVSEMLSWTCMTPFYCEDVVYRREDLERENEDGLTTLMYLQVRRPGSTVRNDACCMDDVCCSTRLARFNHRGDALFYFLHTENESTSACPINRNMRFSHIEGIAYDGEARLLRVRSSGQRSER